MISPLEDAMQIIVEDDGEGFDPAAVNYESFEEGGFGLYNIQERINMLGGSI